MTNTTGTLLRVGVAVDDAVAVADAVKDGERNSPVMTADVETLRVTDFEGSALDEVEVVALLVSDIIEERDNVDVADEV
jgi:hypothetical protein